MQIEEQIQKLLRLKAKIDLYKNLISHLNVESGLKDDFHASIENAHPGVLKEFFEELHAFASKRVGVLDSSGASQPAPAQAAPQVQPPKPEKRPVESDPNAEPRDPLSFMRKYQHLYGKKVSWATPDGTVTGTVRGIVVPYLKVDTDTGFTVTVEPKQIQVA
jgi:hypothetical protein